MSIHQAREPGATRRSLALWAALALAFGPLNVSAETHDGESMSAKDEVIRVLNASATAWTNGDLAAFMSCYEDDPRTAYVTPNGPIKGYAAIHDMYAARFGAASGPGALGTLTMDLLDFRALGEDYALVTGRYHLARSGHPNATGVFTLIFHKSAVGWRIISDHTA